MPLKKNQMYSCDVWMWESDTVPQQQRYGFVFEASKCQRFCWSCRMTCTLSLSYNMWRRPNSKVIYLIFPPQDASTNIKPHFLFINYSNHLFTMVTNTQFYMFDQ